MKKQGINPVNWSKNIIIVDADFVDHVAFDLIVNFERMLGRRIPQADLSQWLVDVALDGRLRPGDHETQVVLLHDRKTPKLLHFSPPTMSPNSTARPSAQNSWASLSSTASPRGRRDRRKVPC